MGILRKKINKYSFNNIVKAQIGFKNRDEL